LVTAAGKNAKERPLAPATAQSVESLIKDAAGDRLPVAPDELDPQRSVPQATLQPSKLPLLGRIARANPTGLDDYRRLGGYEGLQKALELGPEGVIREVAASRLLGRGGAAFPTAKKWEALHLQRQLLKENPNRRHYVICNA